jgi:hypothetical protein
MYGFQAGYTYETGAGLCIRCQGAGGAYPVIVFALMLSLAAAVYVARRTTCGPRCAWFTQNFIIRFIVQIDKGMVKVLLIILLHSAYDEYLVQQVILSTFQIILSISWSLEIRYPVILQMETFTLFFLNCNSSQAPFSQMLKLLAPLQMEFLSLKCARYILSFPSLELIFFVHALLAP